MGAPDALQGAVRHRQVELADQPAGAEGGQRLPQLDDVVLDLGRCLAGLVMRGTGEFDQTRRPVLLVATQPLAHGGHGGSEQSGGRFDAALSGGLDEA